MLVDKNQIKFACMRISEENIYLCIVSGVAIEITITPGPEVPLYLCVIMGGSGWYSLGPPMPLCVSGTQQPRHIPSITLEYYNEHKVLGHFGCHKGEPNP